MCSMANARPVSSWVSWSASAVLPVPGLLFRRRRPTAVVAQHPRRPPRWKAAGRSAADRWVAQVCLMRGLGLGFGAEDDFPASERAA